MRASIEKLININSAGIATRLLLLPLSLGAQLYRLCISIRTLLYKWNIFSAYSLPCKVVTIGNITVGGTGKTPTVCRLARFFQNEGRRVVVLNRGYRGRRSGGPQNVSDGQKILASVEDVGDEAYMLAKKLAGIPVIAAKDRVAAGETAVKLFNAQIVILDDGFQYLRLKRDLDIVLINTENPFGNGCLLPRGTLREPLSALKRAPFVLLTKTGTAGRDLKKLEKSIKKHNPAARIFKSSFRAAGLIKVQGGREIPLDFVKGRRAVGLCSIGDPDGFFSMLNALNVCLVEKLAFPDHHTYQKKDYRRIEQWAEKSELVITTEKDIAKIDSDMIEKEKLVVLKIELAVENEGLFFRAVKEFAGIKP